jgi:hypothetical protein
MLNRSNLGLCNIARAYERRMPCAREKSEEKDGRCVLLLESNPLLGE